MAVGVRATGRRWRDLPTWFLKIMVAATSLLLIIAATEVLSRLAYEPRPIGRDWPFEWDADKVYRLKSNWNGWFAGRHLVTNSRGHRGAEVSTRKPSRTMRVLVLGDSVSFGWNVEGDDAYPQVLERMLDARLDGRFEVINTAAPGNAGFHEYYDLERSMVLDPDFVVVQFCLNDVTEPYHVYRRLGGRGSDYHRIPDLGYLHYLLTQYSASYLLLQDLSSHLRSGSPWRPASQEDERQREFYSAENLIEAPEDPRIRAGWREYLRWLDAIVELTRSKRIPVLLFAAPFDFQLARPSVDAYPQRKLERYAAGRGITYVDWLEALQRVATGSPLELPREEVDRRLPFYDAEHFHRVWSHYFLDHDHPSPAGHRFAARLLSRRIRTLVEKRSPLENPATASSLLPGDR